MKNLPRIEYGCGRADESDSRGPGFYCCRCNGYNPERLELCRFCGHHVCGLERKPEHSQAPLFTEEVEG